MQNLVETPVSLEGPDAVNQFGPDHQTPIAGLWNTAPEGAAGSDGETILTQGLYDRAASFDLSI
jgi:hypothetical protein